MKEVTLPTKLREIANSIAKSGGESYLVGGAVIDILQDRELKDWDIEVYKLSLEQLQSILSTHGKPSLVGKSFGVIKIRIDEIEYDFSIPRKENRSGVGHKDFNIELVPFISHKEAAERRDLTINSMFYNLLDGTFKDPYNGMADLEAGVLRHVSDKFTEDPLRVLRIMQLLPRKGNRVDAKTIELCRSLSPEFPSLVKERVFEEWNKLMRSPKPSRGLYFLEKCDWIKWFPDLDALRETGQNPEHHPEGSVWTHTLMVVNNAAQLRKDVPEEWQLAYMYGTLLHDVGKPSTTLEDFTAYGHEDVGEAIAVEFMRRLTDDKDLIEKVASIVGNHMRPWNLTSGGGKKSAWKRLHNDIPLNIIGMVSKADGSASRGRSLGDYHKPSEKCFEVFEELGAIEDKIPPVLMGRDLIEAGIEPGPQFKEILDQAYNIQIEEDIIDKELLLKRVL
jgi:tRNA nucleotidyltransferase (CCA-adding enzyme)